MAVQRLQITASVAIRSLLLRFLMLVDRLDVYDLTARYSGAQGACEGVHRVRVCYQSDGVIGTACLTTDGCRMLVTV